MKKNDWLIIAAGLILAAMIYTGLRIYQWNQQDADLSVEVYIDGELEETIGLMSYGTYRYETDMGLNVIEVNEEGASIVEADCPDLSCTRQHAINHSGENIVCLPHRFHIVVNGSQEVEIDAISQ